MSGVGVADNTALFDSFMVKKDKPVQAKKEVEPPKKEVPVTPVKDNAKIESSKETTASKNLGFVEKNEKYEIGALPDPNTGEVGKFKVDDKGKPVLDSNGDLTLDPNGKTLFIKIKENGEPIPNEKGLIQFVDPPKEENISQDIKAPTSSFPLQTKENKTNTDDEIMAVPQGVDGTGEVRLVKVDDKGIPLFDKNGGLIDDPKGKPAYIKVDKDMKPELNEKGEPIYLSPDDVPALRMQKSIDESHAKNRLLEGVAVKMAVTGTMKSLSTKLITGFAVKVPLTGGKIIGVGTEYAVAIASKAVIKELAEASTKTIAKEVTKEITKTLAKEAAVGTVKALATGGHIAADVGNVVLKSSLKSAEKIVAETTVKAGTKGVIKAVEKNMVKAGEKALANGLAKSAEKGVEVAIKAAGKGATAKLTTEGAVVVTKVATEAAVKAGTKGAAKGGTKLASLIPIAGAVAGAAITAWDAKDAWDKHHDPKTTKTSKYLADATVALDGISTACTATGIGAPIGWIATGASVVTSVLSDVWRYKNPF